MTSLVMARIVSSLAPLEILRVGVFLLICWTRTPAGNVPFQRTGTFSTLLMIAYKLLDLLFFSFGFRLLTTNYLISSLGGGLSRAWPSSDFLSVFPTGFAPPGTAFSSLNFQSLFL